jgi:hypothetical protein
MGSTYLSLHYHFVFSTKERRPFMNDSWRSKMHEYLVGTVRGRSRTEAKGPCPGLALRWYETGPVLITAYSPLQAETCIIS